MSLTYTVPNDDDILFKAEWKSIAYICGIFFIQLSNDGHITCLYFLAPAGDESMGTGVVISISHSDAVPLCINPEVWLLDIMVLPFSVLFFFEKFPCHFP